MQTFRAKNTLIDASKSKHKCNIEEVVVHELEVVLHVKVLLHLTGAESENYYC